jgi:MFS family permease
MLLAFILAALTFTETVAVWHVVGLAAGLGLVNSFDGPARQAFVIDMVGHDDLSNAIAVNSMMFNGARFVGPAVGGVLLTLLGAKWCFLINGLSFLAVIVALLFMRVSAHPHSHGGGSPWEQLRSGLRYVASQPTIYGLLLLSLFLSIFGISYMTVMPAFVDKVLGQQAAAYGWLTAATGLGAVVGGIALARYGERSRRRGMWLLASSIGFPVVLGLFANNPNYLLAFPLAFGLGVGFMNQYVLINTLLQKQVGDDMRGRVLSLYTLTFFGFAPFGNLLVGSLAEAWGLTMAIGVFAAAALALGAVIHAAIPKVRQLV